MAPVVVPPQENEPAQPRAVAHGRRGLDRGVGAVLRVDKGEGGLGCAADAVWTDPPYNVAYEGTAGSIQNDALSDADFYGRFCLTPDDGVAEYWRSGGATGTPLFYPRSFADIRAAMVGSI